MFLAKGLIIGVDDDNVVVVVDDDDDDDDDDEAMLLVYLWNGYEISVGVICC